MTRLSYIGFDSYSSEISLFWDLYMTVMKRCKCKLLTDLHFLSFDTRRFAIITRGIYDSTLSAKSPKTTN